ncbi:unnamed protein product [Withania somnifera]
MVIIQSKTPYPPCLSCTCTGNQCKHFGYPNQLITIESTNFDVTVVILKDGCLAPTDLCCNCVPLCRDKLGHVKDMPKIGI